MNDVNVFQEVIADLHHFTYKYIATALELFTSEQERVVDLAMRLAQLAIEESPSNYFSQERGIEILQEMEKDVFARVFMEKLAGTMELKCLSYGVDASSFCVKFAETFYSKRPPVETDAIFPGHFTVMTERITKDRTKLWYFALYFLTATWHLSSVRELFQAVDSGAGAPDPKK